MTGHIFDVCQTEQPRQTDAIIKCTISIFDALPEAKGFGSFHSGILGHLLIFVYEPVK